MNIIPFDSAVPAHIAARASTANQFAALGGAGFPVVSIKSKVFHVKRGGELQLVSVPDDPETPASSLEVVIVGGGGHLSKIYYAKGYEEGDDGKPVCYSNDGIAPALDASAPQAAKCAVCPHAVWGSKITETGKQTKACGDAARIAIVPSGTLDDPMLLRVPPASLAALRLYGELLHKRNVQPYQVVTRIGFDYTVSHPALTFKPIGFVTDEALTQIDKTRAGDVVAQIVGVSVAPADAAPAPVAPATPAPAAVAPKAASPAKPKAAAKAAPKPTEAEAPPAAAPSVATAEILAGLDALEFDDIDD